MAGYIPEAGDVVRIRLGQVEPRLETALVLSPASYNRRTELMVACPVANMPKGYPFEVPIEGFGYALSDHIRSINWRECGALRAGEADDVAMEDCLGRLRALLQL